MLICRSKKIIAERVTCCTFENNQTLGKSYKHLRRVRKHIAVFLLPILMAKHFSTDEHALITSQSVKRITAVEQMLREAKNQNKIQF